MEFKRVLNRPFGKSTPFKAFIGLILLPLIFDLNAFAQSQSRVRDIFGRTVNTSGITLTDWDGYMANPLLKFFILAPTNASLPGSATIKINGARLYFDLPSSVSNNGPSKTISIANVTTSVPIRLSIFPDRDSLDEDYTLTIVFTGANSVKQTNTVPIHVIDQDLQRTNDFVVIQNFDRDITGFLTNATTRAIVTQAAEDWGYFFADMKLDTVPARQETTYIWSNNNNGGYYFANTNAFKGYLLYTYGFTNTAHTSGGQGNWNGPVQTSQGVPLKMKRSGSYNAEIYGNYNSLGWLFITNDNSWLASGNFNDEPNDFYSIAHHEIGHALVFDRSHPGFGLFATNGAFTNVTITNYLGGNIPIDSANHFNGSIDPESGCGAFGYEYYGTVPRKRWLITKLDLLCAQASGYGLRSNSIFTPLTFPSNALPSAASGILFSNTFTASGGIFSYHWDIVAGALPTGLSLDSFTGALTGIPTTNGTFNFTVRVRDYHEIGNAVTQNRVMNITSPPPAQLSLSLHNGETNPEMRLILAGTTGQRQVIQTSSNLVNWISIATNTIGTNLFQFVETNALNFPQRFYRSMVIP